MKRNGFAGWTIALAALVASTGFTALVAGDARASSDREDKVGTREAGDVDEVHKVLVASREAGYARVLEIEREHDGYKVNALDDEGRRVELSVDAEGVLRAGDGDDDRRADDDGQDD